MTSGTRGQIRALVLIAFLFGALGVHVVGGASASGETTASPPPTANATETTEATTQCEDPDLPQLQRATVYASDSTIGESGAGLIAGNFTVSEDSTCPVVIEVMFIVPNELILSSDDGLSTTAPPTERFTIAPANSAGIEVEVFGQRSGTASIIVEVHYWPVGNPEMSQSIQFGDIPFDVSSPTTPQIAPTTTAEQGLLDGAVGFCPYLIMFLLALLGLAGMWKSSQGPVINLRK